MRIAASKLECNQLFNINILTFKTCIKLIRETWPGLMQRERERGPKVTNEDFSNRLDSESVKIIFEHFGSETII